MSEADAWQTIVQEKATEIARAEIAVKHQNREITRAGEIRDKAEAARESLETVKEKAAAAEKEGNTDAAAEAGQVA
jgi:hypothetical protein